MKKNFAEVRKSTRFIEKVLEFIESLETDVISVRSVLDGGVHHDCIIKHPQYEILHEENVLCLFDEEQANALQIPIDEVTGVSNTVFADSVACSVCFRRNGLYGVIISAVC